MISLAALTALLAGCGGASHSTVLPTASGGSAQSAKTSNATLSLKIPAKTTTTASGIKPAYVSASTQSVKIANGTTTLGTFNTTPTSTGCAAVNGVTTCSFSVTLPVGSATVSVTAFDAANGSGNQLSNGSLTQTIVAGQNNVIPVTMSGTVASISAAIAVQTTPNAGTAANVPVVIMAKDADGNVIVGPGNYSAPITLTDSDGSGITKLSRNGGTNAASVTVNGPSDQVLLAYNGNSLTSVSLTPSATGVTNATAATFAPVPTTIAMHPMPSDPVNGLSAEPGPIALGNDGNLWTSYYSSQAPYGGIAKMTTSGTYTMMPDGTSNLNDYVNGLATGGSGASQVVWFVYSNISSGNLGGSIDATGTVTNFTASTPLCNNTGNENAHSITPDGHGGVWIAIMCWSDNAIQLAHVDSSNTVTINNEIPSFRGNGSVIVGKDGNLYVSGQDAATGQPAVVQAVVSGATVSSTSTVVNSTATGAYAYFDLKQAADGDLWLVNDNCTPSAYGRLHLATPFTASTFSEILTPQGCANPSNLVALADGSLWAPNDDYGTIVQIVPTANQGAPALASFAPPTGNNFFPYYYQGVEAPNGHLYFTDYNYYCCSGQYTQSGEILELAY